MTKCAPGRVGTSGKRPTLRAGQAVRRCHDRDTTLPTAARPRRRQACGRGNVGLKRRGDTVGLMVAARSVTRMR